MKRILLALLCLLTFPVAASHIVGGEFEILYLGNNQYRINLIYYFDLNNNTFTNPPQQAQPELQEPVITTAIFRKSDNVFIRNVTLTFLSKTRVTYTQPSCSRGEILTDKLIYTTVITMTDAQYNSPQGYYITWERCCRNYTITNIISNPPAFGVIDDPNTAGQTFYLEFPPVVKDGQKFINSSPKLFPPLNDYACPGKPYYADFRGTDDDGDSLVYSLVTPYSTHTSEATPPLKPAPFTYVKWRAPFSLNNIVGGKPDLKVSNAGFLTVTPQLQGLYVFAVKCEEFRNGIKIGEVRRDFQMLVVDQCEHAEPPQILGKKLQDAAFSFDEEMFVSFTNDVTDDNRCIEVQVSDPDASNVLDNFTEKIKIKAIPLNFKTNIDKILPSVTSTVLDHGSKETFRICFDRCPPFNGGPFQIGIVAYDDACSLPLSDTLKVTVNLEPPDNNKPTFYVDNVPMEQLVIERKEGTAKQTWNIDAIDLDDDMMQMFVLPEPGFTLDKAGMEFKVIGQTGNTLHAQFSWDPNCSVYDFTKKTEFKIRFLVEDNDDCVTKNPDILDFRLRIELPPDGNPKITSDLPETLVKNGITKKIFETLEFNVYGQDADHYLLKLRGQGKDFKFSDYNISFPSVTGFSPIQSHFKWNINCDKIDLSKKSDFDLAFILVDSVNKCHLYKTDTLKIKVKVEPPDNHKPIFNIVNTNDELTFENNQQTVIAGQQISLALISNDSDVNPQDKIVIDIVKFEGDKEPVGYVFAPAEGIGSAETTFTWNTDCSLFSDGDYENNYAFTFYTKDNRCFNVKGDTVEVKLTIKDRTINEADFIPPNIITHNGDGDNEFFAMVKEVDGVLVDILPPDNCIGKFVTISIYNRWGTNVFESDSRNFRWYPVNEAAGIYFYTLKYSNKEYKGSITLMN